MGGTSTPPSRRCSTELLASRTNNAAMARPTPFCISASSRNEWPPFRRNTRACQWPPTGKARAIPYFSGPVF
eukprot:965239-Pyramimonas_sp.AAC.1